MGAVQPHSNLVCAAAVVPYTDKEEGFAVARLIAAAPELLAALECIARGCEEATDDGLTYQVEAMGAMARTAIAKANAKGQQ